MPELKCIPSLPLVFPESQRHERGKQGAGGGDGEDSVRGKEINDRVDSVHIHLLVHKKITVPL